MTKTLTNSAFIVACLVVVMVFVTAETFSQIAVAVILYPALIFAAFMIFPRKSIKPQKITVEEQPRLHQAVADNPKPQTETTTVADIDRRTFIKLIGATGISFFLFSIFGRSVENLFFGRSGQSGIQPAESNTQSNPTSPTDGFKISEIDEGEVSYYGFINKDGAWLVMQEGTDGSSFRYVKGDSNFPGNWSNRENLKYDYYYNLF